jgi:hypothetical protein
MNLAQIPMMNLAVHLKILIHQIINQAIHYENKITFTKWIIFTIPLFAGLMMIVQGTFEDKIL